MCVVLFFVAFFVSGSNPEGQSVHRSTDFAAHSVPYFPGKQYQHDVDASESCHVPGEHLSQDAFFVDPNVVLKYPVGQASQSRAFTTPVRPLYLPEGQSLQDSRDTDPVSSMYFPDGHPMHAAWAEVS